MPINITLTEEEAQVVLDYLTRKCYRLEEADLRDSFCYPRLYSVCHKIMKAADITPIKTEEAK